MSNDYFEVELDCVNACGKVEKMEIIASFGQIPKSKISILMARFPHREWFAYLIGKQDSNKYMIEDLYIPKQYATAGHVGKIDASEYNNLSIVGAIHSHHRMNLRDFSQHDHEFVNSNHNLSMVVTIDKNDKIHMQGQVRVTTPCGALMPIPVKTEQNFLDIVDEGAFLTEIDNKFHKPQPKKKKKNNKRYELPTATIKINKSQVPEETWDKTDEENIYDIFIKL